MSPRVLRSHRVFAGRSTGWRRRRADRELERQQHRQNGRWADVPEVRLPHQRFTITAESCWSQPGGYSDDQACAVRPERGQESDAA